MENELRQGNFIYQNIEVGNQTFKTVIEVDFETLRDMRYRRVNKSHLKGVHSGIPLDNKLINEVVNCLENSDISISVESEGCYDINLNDQYVATVNEYHHLQNIIYYLQGYKELDLDIVEFFKGE